MNPPFLAGVILAAGDQVGEGIGGLAIVCVLYFLYSAFRTGWDGRY